MEFEFIKGYENLYKINRNGEVYSCHYNKIIKPQLKVDGYLFIHLSKEGIRKKFYVHRITALQYIENPDNLPEVDHIDRNKQNNCVENLRWVTRIMNARNKATYKDNLSEEEKKARDDRRKERQRLWAEKKRRSLGAIPQDQRTKTKDAIAARNKRNNK